MLGGISPAKSTWEFSAAVGKTAAEQLKVGPRTWRTFLAKVFTGRDVTFLQFLNSPLAKHPSVPIPVVMALVFLLLRSRLLRRTRRVFCRNQGTFAALSFAELKAVPRRGSQCEIGITR